jgi:hypothetical protein
MGKSPPAHALAEMRDRWRVTEKLLEAHGLSLRHVQAPVLGLIA